MASIINKISFSNFRSFKEKQILETPKITFFTGANSSGKSSILYTMLAPLQSQGFPFILSPNGKYINLGDFKEISNDHILSNQIEIDFELYSTEDKLSTLIFTKWSWDIYNDLPVLNYFESVENHCQIKLRKESSNYLLDLRYNPDLDPNKYQKRFLTLLQEEFPAVNLDQVKKKKSDSEKKQYLTIEKSLLEAMNEFCELKDVPFVINAKGKKFKTKNRFSLRADNSLTAISRLFSNFDNDLNYIGSLRLHPERTYLERSQNESKIKTFGDGYLDQILSWQKNDKTKFKELLKILNDLKIISSLKTNRIGGGRYEIKVSTYNNKMLSSLHDTGFGVSQFLPIIVADLQLPNQSTLFISQPEIHLHPSAQADFGTYLANQSRLKEKRYFIETHSEYLLNRMRLMVVQKKLNKDDITVYHVEKIGDNSVIHKIQIDKNGDYINAPKDFFETYYLDVKDIAINSFND